MATLDYDAIKEIPGYKVIMKSVLKSLIQQLVEQLASHTEEESVILTANVSDGTLSHLGSDSGKTFLDDHEDIKSQFLGFCLKRHHRKKQDKEKEEQEEAMRVAANQFAMRGQAAPHFVNRSPRLQSPRQPGVHPVSMSRATPGARGQRHEPYPLNRPRKQSETQSSPSAGPTMQLPVSGNTEIKTEPVEENNENGNENTPSQNPEDDAKLDMSSSLNEGQDVKTSETLPSGELGFDSSLVGDVSQHSDNNTDTGEPNIKMEAFGDSEMDLEITGVEQGMPLAPQENWGPSTSTGFDQSGATGSPGDVQGFMKEEEQFKIKRAFGTLNTSSSVHMSNLVVSPIKIMGQKDVFECHICGRQFSKKWDFKRHLGTHDSIKPFKCNFCDFETKRKDHLKSHVWSKHMFPKQKRH